MKNTLILIFCSIILISCQQSSKEIDLLADSSRWIGAEELVTDDQGISLTGENRMYVYDPGFLRTFQNFELRAEVRTDSGAVAAIRFHTSIKDAAKGYEVRIDNTAPGDWSRLLKTGSLSAIRNVNYNILPDNQWFELKVRVVENTIRIFVNDHPVVNYTEPELAFRTAEFEKRKLGSGTFAIELLYGNTSLDIKNLYVNKLPAAEVSKTADPVLVKQITMLHIRNFPLADYHVHLKQGLSMEMALDSSAIYGINYGIATNCGLKFPIQNDAEMEAYLHSLEGLPVYKAIQAEGREWVDMFSPELVAKFDYAFTDAMTWTNKNGVRQRLWIPEETDVGDPEDFMDQLVAQIEKVVTEPVAIYVNPTFLPKEIAGRYDELWTDDRIDRVVAALKENNVALELNNRYQIPGRRVIQKAREAGVKFAMGTNNTSENDLGHLDWALQMVHDFNLQASDMYLPGAIQD